MYRWIISVIMTILTLVTGGVVTWQVNDAPQTVDEQKMIEQVKQTVDQSLMKYVIVKYGIDWQNGDQAIVSGRTIFNMPIVTAQVDKRSLR